MTDRNHTLRQRWFYHRKAAAGNFLAVAILNLCALSPCLAQSPVEAGKPVQAGKPVEFEQLPMRRVSVPIDQLDVILARDRRGVLLPRDEFLKLYTAALRRAQDTPRMPAGIVLSNVEYQARIAGQQLLITAKIEFTQFAAGWQTLVLPFRGLLVEKATLDGKQARLGRLSKQGDTLQLLNNRTGKSTLLLELSAMLAAVGSDQVAAFGLIPSPSATLNVTLPAGKHLLIDGLVVERPAPLEEQALFELVVGGRREVTLRITDRQTSQTTDALVFASTGFVLDVSPGEVTWQASTMLQLFGRRIDQLVFTVPKTLEIADVESTGLESWELADDDQDRSRTAITLKFRQPIAAGRKILFKGVTTDRAAGQWTVPNLQLKNVTSHVGRILVRYPSGVRLELAEMKGVRRSAPEITPQTPRANRTPAVQATGLVFNVWREDFELAFVTRTKQREIHANLLTSLNITSRGVDLGTIARIESFYAPLFELNLTLPAEWTITSAALDGRRVSWQTIPENAGTHQVRIAVDPPLVPGREIRLTISAHLDLEDWLLGAQSAEFELPEVRIEQASVVDGAYVLKADPDFELVPIDVEGLDPAHLNLPGERAGFRYQDTRFSGRLQVVAKPPRISARTRTFTRLDPQALRSHLEINVDVEGGGLRSLQFALPESASQELRFVLRGNQARIVEQRAAPPADDKRIWTLRFNRRVKGELSFSVDVETPRKDAKQFSLHAIEVINAERQNGYLAIEAGSEQRLKIEAVDRDKRPLPEVDPVDLPATRYVPRQRIVAAFQYVVPGYRVSFSEERFEQVALPTAVCSKSTLKSILGENGEFQHQAMFTFVAVGVQSLRVALPESARLWSVLVDGKPTEVRRAQQAFRIPLPATGRPDQTRTLTLYYQTTLDPFDMFTHIQQDPPKLSVISGQGTEQPLEILDQHWSLSYPPGELLIASDGRFQPLEELDRSSLLSRFQQSFSVASPDQLFWNSVFVIVTVAVIAVLTLGFRRWRYFGLLLAPGVLLLIGLALLLIASLGNHSGAKFAYPAGELLDLEGETQSSFGTGGAKFEMTDGSASNTSGPLLRRQAMEFLQVPSDTIIRPDESTDDDIGEDMEESTVARTARPDTGERGSAPATREPQQLNLGSTDELVAQANQPGDGAAQPAGPPADEGQGGRPFVSENVHGARLSIPVEFDLPAHRAVKRFRYLGSGGEADSNSLDVAFENRELGGVFRMIVLAGVLLLFWWLRNQPLRVRGIVGSMAIAVPLAVVTLVPVSWHVVLDGWFLGALSGVAVWSLRSICCRCKSLAMNCEDPRLSWLRTISNLLLLVLLAGSGNRLFAQEKMKSPPKQDRLESRSPSQPTIVVPYDPDGDPLAVERVFLPHDKFIELWNQAYPEKRVQRPAPVAGFVSAAVYTAQLQQSGEDGQSHVSVTGRIVLHSFRDHQITLPLPLESVALRSAKLNGKTAPLVAKTDQPGGAQRVVLDQPGIHVLDVVFDLPAKLTGPAGQFQITLQRVPAGRFTFSLPAPGLNVRVNGSGSVYRRRMQGETELVEIPTDRGGKLTVAWQPKQTRGAVDAIVHAETQTAVSIEDAGARLYSEFLFRIRQGTLSDVAFSLPSALKVKRIRGPDVGGWAMEGEGEARSIRVFLRRRVSDQTRIAFELYLAADVGSESLTLTVPQFAPQETTRETGSIAVYAGRQFDLRAGQTSGVKQINAAEFQRPAEFKLPQPIPRLAYRYTARPFVLPLFVSRRAPKSTVTAEYGVFVGLRKLKLTSHFAVELKGAPRSHLTVLLPDGYLPLNVDATHLSDWYLREAGGATNLVLELDSPRVGSVEIALQGIVSKEPDEDLVEISLPLLGETGRMTSQLAVWIDEAYSATVDDPGGWRPQNREELSADLRRLEKRPPQFAFRSTEPEPSFILFELRRAAAQLAADSVVIITVTDTSVNYTLALAWQIRQAAADEFVFTTPGWLAGKLDFTATGLRQVTQTELDDGRIRWIVRLQSPQRGRYFLTAIATLPPPATDPDQPQAAAEVRAPALVFEQTTVDEEDEGEQTFMPLDASRSRHFVVLVNLSHSQLTPAAEDVVEPEAGELPIKVRRTLLDQATEVSRLRKAEVAPVWEVRKFEQQKGAPASVNLAELKTVIARDGTWRTQASYRIKNRSRQFLALDIPPGSKLLSVFVQGRPSRPARAKGQSFQLIALPKTSRADLSFEVKLVLADRLATGALPRGFWLSQQVIELPAPRVLSVKDSPDFGMPVARTQWTVHLPEELDVNLIDGQSNVALTTASSTELVQRLVAIKEAAKLFNVLEGISSGRSKYKALSNLKQLDLAINAEIVDRSKKSNNAQSSETEIQNFREQQQEFNQRLFESRRRAQVDEAGRKVILRDASGSMNTPELDQRAQKLYLDLQNQELFLDNDNRDTSGVARGPKDDGEDRFRLQLKQPPSQKPGGPVGRGGVSKPGVGGRKRSGRRIQSRLKLEEDARELHKQQQEQLRTPGTDKPDDSLPGEGKPGQNQSDDGAPMESAGGQRGEGDEQGGGKERPVAAGGEQVATAWTAAGGLSLLIDVPTAGQELTFSKVSGAPKLTLAVRPRESLETGFGMIWTVVWLALGIGTAISLSRPGGAAAIRRHFPTALIAVGLIAYFLLPTWMAWLGFVAFFAGAATIGFRHRAVER